jgi:hypothetical protein
MHTLPLQLAYRLKYQRKKLPACSREQNVEPSQNSVIQTVIFSDRGMLERSKLDDGPVIAFDGRQSAIAAEIQRGICRALRALGHSVVCELGLANGRRADVVALSPGADIWIVEIKSCLVDFQTDGKWKDYLDYCDRLYFAVSPDFPREVLPHDAGLALADRYGAEFVREPVEERLCAARRKAMMLCFARAAALRLQRHLDPACEFDL